MNGQKTGGRTAGTPNKRTAELIERLAELECDPVERLAKIAADPTADAALRARVYADLLPYLYPRRKALEVAGPDNAPLQISWITRTIVDPRAPNTEAPPVNAE